jgi:hypothetical protein
MTGGWGAKRTSKAKALSVNPRFQNRFRRVLKKFSDDDERDLFKSAFDAWMSLSTSRTGMKVKTFLKKHGEAGIRLMGKAFVKPADGEDLSKVNPLELGDRVMQSKRLNQIVQDAGEANPASMRGLMETEQQQHGTSTVRSIFASAAPPQTESHEVQVASLEAIGLIEPADKPLPSADDAADVDLLPAAPKKGKPKAAEGGPFGIREWFDEDAPTEANGLSVLHSIMGGVHSRDKKKKGKAAADLNRNYKVVEMLTGVGGRAGRVRRLEGPLHYGNHHKKENKYPRLVDANQTILSLMQSISQQYEIPVRTKANETIPNKAPHSRSANERIALFNALEQKKTVQMPSYWRDIVNNRKTSNEKKVADNVNGLWAKINKDMASAPLSYMDLMQKHGHHIADLDRAVAAIHGPRRPAGTRAPRDRTRVIQKQFQLLPIAVKAAKKASIAYDKTQKKFSDTQLRDRYKVPAPKKGGGRVTGRLSGNFGVARSPSRPARSRSRSPGRFLARSRSRSPVDDEKAQPAPAVLLHAMGVGAPQPRAGAQPRPRRGRGRGRGGRRGRGGLARGRGRGGPLPAAALAPGPALPAVVLQQRHEQRTHLYANSTANIWQSTGYRRSIDGDMVPPETGRVHLVRPGDLSDPVEHFMRGMEPTTDANMGRKKSGPFKHMRGRSLVMSKSRYTSVRKRDDALEITLRRGVTSSEVDNVISRLTSHRLAVHSTWVYLMVGSKSHKIGKLASIDFEKLRRKVYSLLAKHTSVGLHVVDEGNHGPMHRHGAHTYRRMKMSSNF